MGKKDNLDRFYTKQHVAEQCVQYLLSKLNKEYVNALYIEPSAGGGSFLDALHNNKVKNVIGYDIAPQREDIIQQDWFCFQCEKKNKIVVIGNPPFGLRNSLAKRFIQHSIEIQADIVAFILPDVFKRYTNQKVFEQYRLIDYFKLPDDSFIFQGRNYSVPCSFFILANDNNIMPKKDMKDIKVSQPQEYNFLKRGDLSADFVLNGNSGRVRTVEEVTNSKAEHYIKVFDRNRVENIKNIFMQLSFPHLSSCNGKNWWINQNDINKAFIQYTKQEQCDNE